MVSSIILDGEFGYIGEKWGDDDKPIKPKKSDWKFWKSGESHIRVFDEEKFKYEMKRYKEDMKVFKKNEGTYRVKCSENLVGRKFEFASDKINIIFGPNASGKTTIMKAIASHAFCEDGFSTFVEPISLSKNFDFDHDTFFESLKMKPVTFAGTSSKIEWDGSPIYYHNFENRKSYGILGDLTGSIIESGIEEINYIMSKGRMSGGQNMFFQLSKLLKLMSSTITFDKILPQKYKKRYEKFGDEDSWGLAYKVQEEYYQSFPMSFDENGQNTYLFDEIDKSMDILNVHLLYTEVLPKMIEKFGKQIIVISHSPIVLCDEVYKSNKYNFISIDEEYTENCREIFRK